MPCLLVTEGGIEVVSTTKSPQESKQSLSRFPLASRCLSIPALIKLLKGREQANHPVELAAGCSVDSDSFDCQSPQIDLSSKDKISAARETDWQHELPRGRRNDLRWRVSISVSYNTKSEPSQDLSNKALQAVFKH